MASPPTNISPATATVIPTGRLPYTETILAAVLALAPQGTNTAYNSTCDTTQYHALWWTYTTGPHETLLSITGDAATATFYSPKVSVWTGASISQVTLDTQNFCENLGGGDTWMQIPVSANTRYWFLVTDVNNNPVDGDLVIQLIAGPQGDAPAKSIVITDDTDGFPALVLTTAGTAVRALTFPAGEWTDTLETGEVCTVDGEANTAIKTYAAGMTTVTGSLTFADGLRAIKSNRSTRFYVVTSDSGDPTDPKLVTALGPTGVPTGQTWTLPADSASAAAFAVNQAGTRIYYGQTLTASAVVHAYDLTNSIALPDLHAAFGVEMLKGAGDGFCLADGSIFMGYSATTAGGTGKIRRFNTAGTVLNTYTLTSGSFVALNHFCYYDETSFLVWGFNHATLQNTSVFRRIRISDGATIGSDFTYPTVGTSGGAVTTTTGYAISNSCPLFVTTAALAPPNPGLPDAPPMPSDAEWDVREIRRMRQAPHLSDEQMFHFYSRFQLDFNAGAMPSPTVPREFQLSWSNDGGATYTNPITVTADVQGQYTMRAVWHRLGRSRDRIFRLTSSNAAPEVWLQAFLDVSKGNGS